MKSKLCLFLSVLLFTTGSVWSQGKIDIPIKKMPNDSIHHPKSFVQSPLPLASLDGTELLLDFSIATSAQVIIFNRSASHQVVYSESFASTTQVIVDLEDEGIGDGHYLLWLFAFGQWWEGEFTLEEASNE